MNSRLGLKCRAAFYPREAQAWSAAHPGHTALEMRRASHAILRRNFVPVHAIRLMFHEEAKRLLGGAEGVRVRPRPNDRAAGHSNTQTRRHSHNLRRIAEASARCPWEPPRDFYEGLNTLWFLREVMAYVDGLCCHALGRPDAKLHPARHLDLMDKVCGFSTRFVSLSKRFQDEVIARHRLMAGEC